MRWQRMHRKLSHLSNEDFEELLLRYYDPEKTYTVTQIISDFEIDAQPGELAKLFPQTIHDEECPYCEGQKLRSTARSRSSTFPNLPTCPNCGHEDRDYCHCSNCRKQEFAEKQEATKHLQALVEHYYGEHSLHHSISVDELNLREMIFLKALVSHKSTEDLKFVVPTAETQTKLAPRSEMIWDMLRPLYHRASVIAPSAESDLSAFKFEDENECPSFFLNKVKWLLLPTLTSTEKINYLSDLDSKLKSLKEAEKFESENRSLWHEIVKSEAIEYYEYKLSEVNVQLDKVGDKTNMIFEDLVDRFSLAQIYHIIFVTVRNTHHWTTQNRIPRYQAKNAYSGALERNANKYEAEGWLKEFRRDFYCPQSTVSAIFFDYYLELGDSYFQTAAPPVTRNSVSP